MKNKNQSMEEASAAESKTVYLIDSEFKKKLIR